MEMTGFGSPCGACKFLRRRCARGCVFAPYFCDEQGAAHFAAIHKVFGASNASKLLAHLPLADRPEAAATISYEAQARLRDPTYGCVAHIFALQQQVHYGCVHEVPGGCRRRRLRFVSRDGV
jgi:LOB domain-containing protein 29